MSVEGIGIVQRPDANEKFYGGQYDPMQILTAPANRLRPAEPDGAAAVVKLQEVCVRVYPGLGVCAYRVSYVTPRHGLLCSRFCYRVTDWWVHLVLSRHAADV